jgi:Asp-tRNA(Asn)/Glu-tRNA(Gln) amidotransferase A subunit family amidase
MSVHERRRVDTNARKTPVPLPFAEWRGLSSQEAAREVQQRIANVPASLRSAALAWLQTERELASELSAPRKLPLSGIPYLAKDLFDVAGVPTRAGSSFLANVRPVPGNSAIVNRLRELGAGLAGKTHLVEFAAGLTGENRTYGDCPHPHFPDRLAGGSSSGSAALVAAGVVPFALGTDTGGSVRVPAAFCGLFGYRGEPGDAFIRDAFPLSPTCDTAGWLTYHRDDMLALLDALVPAPTPAAGEPRGIFLRAGDLGLHAEVDEPCARAAYPFAAHADEITREALRTSWQKSVDAYATIVMSEAHVIHRDWLPKFREHYDPAIWQRIADAGNFPSEKLDRAHAIARQIRATFVQLFDRFDFLVLPCAPMAALTKAQCTTDARRSILTLTSPGSLAGLPALTVPVRLESGLTAGLQILFPHSRSAALRWVLGRCANAAP